MIKILNYPIGEKWDSSSVIKWMGQLTVAFNNLTDTGTTAQRPNPAPYIGFMYYDTTINRPIWAKTTTQYVFADGTNA
jgi:Ca2+-dependent lipid-binding protein